VKSTIGLTGTHLHRERQRAGRQVSESVDAGCARSGSLTLAVQMSGMLRVSPDTTLARDACLATRHSPLETRLSHPAKESDRVTTEISRLRALARLAPSLEPVRDTQITFRVLLDAMARPGTVRALPVAARDAPVNPWLAAALITLLDHEVSLAVEPFAGSDQIELFVRQRTAVARATAVRADFVLASADALDASLPTKLRQGTLAYPNDSATLVILVPSLDQANADGLLLALAGPGCPSGHTFRVAGLTPALFEARDEVAEYPRGIDLILIDPSGRVAALPRSTAIQVARAAAPIDAGAAEAASEG
jgi:alpha-D-ribose 1-methylphosphonate 5-triphosphate synthase subunit PhnH